MAAVPLVVASPASAQANVTKADFSGGTLRIQGNAIWDRPITVDGVVMATSDAGGTFTISRSGYTPPADCTVDVNDGSARATTIRLTGCSPTDATAAILPDRAELGPFTAGVPLGSTTVSFAGSIGPDRWQIVGGALPSGLTMSVPTPTPLPRPNTPQQLTYALISGTPTVVGTGTVTFRASDANGQTATRTYTVTVNPAVSVAITPEPWPTSTVGDFTNLWIDGSGGVQPYSWSVVAGALPPGMTLIQDSPTGPSVRVGGTPATEGSFTWALRLTDLQGATTTRTFTATVAAPAPPAPEPAPTPAPQPAPAFVSIASLSLNPTSVLGGTSSTGTVTITAPAPAGGTAVFLFSGSPAATVPSTVTVPAGATSATFPITTAAVSAPTSSSIEATYAGTLTSRLSITTVAPASADAVSIGRAEYDSAKHQLRVEATSSKAGAVLRVYVAGTNTMIGTLSAGGGTFGVAGNPGGIIVTSSLGGSSAKTVTAR